MYRTDNKSSFTILRITNVSHDCEFSLFLGDRFSIGTTTIMF